MAAEAIESLKVTPAQIELEKLPKESPIVVMVVLVTSIVSLIISIGLFFSYLGINYNYDVKGNLIKDSTYNQAMTVRMWSGIFFIIFILFAIIGAVY